VKALLLAPLLALGCAHANSATPGIALEDAMAAAAAKHVAVVVELRAHDCRACDDFDRDVAARPPAQELLARVVFARYDVSTPDGADAAHRIGSPPSGLVFYILDHERRIVAFHSGTLDADELARFVEHALDVEGGVAALSQAPADPRAWLRQARWDRSHQREEDALRLYERVAQDTEAFAVVRDDAAWELLCLRARRAQEDRIDGAALLEYVREHPSSDQLWNAFYALLVAEGVDVAALDELVLRRAEDQQPDGLVVYSQIALAGHAYGAALALAQRAVEKLPDARRLGALAEVYHYRGELAMARTLAGKAAAMAPGDAYLAEKRTRIERGDGTPAAEVQRMRRIGAAIGQLIFGRVVVELR
jgi:tetratricopeptide (TPR) repeat protein